MRIYKPIILIYKMLKHLNSLHHILKYPLPKYPSPHQTQTGLAFTTCPSGYNCLIICRIILTGCWDFQSQLFVFLGFVIRSFVQTIITSSNPFPPA